MIIYFIFLLAGVSVTCADSSYIVVEMPEEPEHPPKTFSVYWNVPTFQCKSKNILFNNLFEKFGIIQNDGDAFRGVGVNKVAMLYEDTEGSFPRLTNNKTTKRIQFRNGGLPQEGDLKKHLSDFGKRLDKFIPDQTFEGIGIIDMETWRPVYRQHFSEYHRLNKNISLAIEKKLHAYSNWWWNNKWLESEAKYRFEDAARTFMRETIRTAKKLRPRATWGYYGYPYCYNMEGKSLQEDCSNETQGENDGLSWLWRESGALYPSLYFSPSSTTSQLTAQIRGRVKEAARFGTTILPYISYSYRDAGFLTEDHLNATLSTLYNSKATGFIIWGASKDVNTNKKCTDLLKYVENVYGPVIATYTKKNLHINEELSPNSHYTDSNIKDTTILGSSVFGDMIRKSTNNILEENDTQVTDNTFTKNYSQLYGESTSTTANAGTELAPGSDSTSVGTHSTSATNNNIDTISLDTADVTELTNAKVKDVTIFSSLTTVNNDITETVTENGILSMPTKNIDPYTPRDSSKEKSTAALETFTREELEIILVDGEPARDKYTYNEYYNTENKQNKGS